MRFRENTVPLESIPRYLASPDLVLNYMRLKGSKLGMSFADKLFAKDSLLHKPLRAKVPLPLRQISIKITNACHLRCKMCAQWGEAGYNFSRPTEEIRENVSLETYKKMVDDAAPFKPIYYIWGGEPFMYRDLVPLLNYMKQKKMTVSLVTSGYKLAENAEEIVRNGWDVLMLSLDGDRETHDHIRGREGTYDTLLRGVEAIREEKKRQGRERPFTMILTTICSENAPTFDRVFEEARVFQPDLVIAYYSWFTTEERGAKQEQIFAQKLGVHAWSWRGWTHNFQDIDVEALQQSIVRIREQDYPFPYIFLPNLKFEDIPHYYQEPGNFFGYDKCVSPWVVAEVMPDGAVAPCRDYPDYVTGNICEESIVDIFNGERFWKFRDTLREEGMFPMCARCCGLMGY